MPVNDSISANVNALITMTSTDGMLSRMFLATLEIGAAAADIPDELRVVPGPDKTTAEEGDSSWHGQSW
jgi:hypothetical protein